MTTKCVLYVEVLVRFPLEAISMRIRTQVLLEIVLLTSTRSTNHECCRACLTQDSSDEADDRRHVLLRLGAGHTRDGSHEGNDATWRDGQHRADAT